MDKKWFAEAHEAMDEMVAELVPEPVEAAVYRKLHETREDHLGDARRARAYQAEVFDLRNGNKEAIDEMMEKAEGTVTISKERYDELVENEQWVCALEAAGVDNWDGYDYAREIFTEGDDT